MSQSVSQSVARSLIELFWTAKKVVFVLAAMPLFYESKMIMMMTAYDEEDYGFEDKYERVFFFFVQWPSVAVEPVG